MNRQPKHQLRPETIGVIVWIITFIILWTLFGGWKGINGRG